MPPDPPDDRSRSSPRPSTEETARRVLDALRRSAARARRIAAQTGTRLVVVRDGELVKEPVPPSGAAPTPDELTAREAALDELSDQAQELGLYDGDSRMLGADGPPPPPPDGRP